MSDLWSALLTPPRRRIPPQVKLKPGDQVGEWTLLDYRCGTKTPRVCGFWYCRCSCGEERWVRSSNLLDGQSKCCGHTRPGGRLPAGNPGDIRTDRPSMAVHMKGP